jgi:methylglutaconyl-CoA hydratase
MQPFVNLSIADHIATLTLNRPDKRNAFDDRLIEQFLSCIQQLQQQDAVRVILLTAAGRHFSAGADLAWMQRMIHASAADNLIDAEQLDQLMYQWYKLPIPTIAIVQGAAYGGAMGLIAGCDIALAGEQATFCFSEVSLGLTPAVISPYVLKAIGERAARRYFLTAEPFTAQQAHALGLIHEVIAEDDLLTHGQRLASRIAAHPPQATTAAKTLIEHVADDIPPAKRQFTTNQIATLRTSADAQQRLTAFLRKQS